MDEVQERLAAGDARMTSLEKQIAALRDDLSPEERQAIVREAIERAAHQWLTETYAAVGKWTLRGLAAAAVVALIMFLGQHGYRIEQFFTGPP